MPEKKIATVLTALEFAADKHRHHRRKDTDASPYINHPISLSSLLCNEASITDTDVLCGALLHDTVEDTETTATELEELFGKNVAKIVMEVTDDKSLPKEARKMAQIEHASDLSEKAKLVKLADKICNLRDIIASPPADWETERKQEYFDWAKSVIDEIRGTNSTLESLFDDVYSQGPGNSL